MKLHIAHQQTTDTPVIEVVDLWRWYRNFWGRKTDALKGVAFGVEPGEVMGLLGPNGAGKTTTLKILLGMLRPSRGSVRLFGRPVSDPTVRSQLGFLSEHPYFYDYLTGREFLDLCGVLCGMAGAPRRRRAHELLDRVGLGNSADLRLRKYSKGMLQRLGLAQALLHNPPLVILDEPMSGLDPLGRSLVRDITLGLKRDGVTVLFSSHVLPDVETLCDRVVIIAGGAVVAQGTIADLTAESDTDFEIVAQDVPARARLEIELSGGTIREVGRRTLVRVGDRAAMNRTVSALVGSGAELIGVSPLRSPIETHFLNALGASGTLHDGGAGTDRGPDGERSEGATWSARPAGWQRAAIVDRPGAGTRPANRGGERPPMADGDEPGESRTGTDS